MIPSDLKIIKISEADGGLSVACVLALQQPGTGSKANTRFGPTVNVTKTSAIAAIKWSFLMESA